MKIQPVKGTRDFYPEQKRILNYIFDKWIKVSENYGYEDFDGPLLEPAMLWQMKSGSDIPEQVYSFPDKNKKMLAIRPELTPTLARMVAQKSAELTKPIKWYSVSRCCRYEAPQAGRLREFFQLNVDCLGSESLLADAEVIATAIAIMQELGCTSNDFYIRLCNRKLIQALLEEFGIKNFQDVMRTIDKKEKMNDAEFKQALKQLKLNDKQIKNIFNLIKWDDLKKIDLKNLSATGKKGYEELNEVIKYLKEMGLSKFIQIDFSIMRGFDYYTSTVFEVFDKKQKYRALAGGGRYDNLVKDFGGREKVPGVGYGMGDVVMELFLKSIGKLPKLSREIDYFVVFMKPDLINGFLKYVYELRKKYSVDMDLMERNFNKQMNYANKIGAKKVIIVAPKEWKQNKIIIKDMKTGKQEIKDLGKFLK